LCTSVLNAITQASTRFEQRPVGCRVASVVGVAAASVFLVGIVRRLVEQRMHAKALKNAASGGSPASGNAQAAGSK